MKELLTLKALSVEQTEVNRYIEVKNERFDMLYSMAESGDIKRYENMGRIRRHFGEPVRALPAKTDPRQSVWYYRPQTQYFGAPEVYLYFDENKNLIEWTAQGGTDGKEQQETP